MRYGYFDTIGAKVVAQPRLKGIGTNRTQVLARKLTHLNLKELHILIPYDEQIRHSLDSVFTDIKTHPLIARICLNPETRSTQTGIELNRVSRPIVSNVEDQCL